VSVLNESAAYLVTLREVLLRAKATSTILLDLPFSPFCSTEKSVVPSAAGTTISPSMIADPALMCQALSATFLKRWSSRSPAG